MVPARKMEMAAKDRLTGLLRYVEELARLAEGAVFSVRSYRELMFFEHQLQNRVGVQHDVADPDGAVWIRIERLQRKNPPKPHVSIAPWLVISRDPDRQPEVSETRLETMPRTAARGLVEARKIDSEDVMKSPSEGNDVVDVRLRLDRLPEVKEEIEDYITGPWRKWSEEEKLRRETIAIYDKFFNVVQFIETSGVERPTEVVFGIGMMLWATEGKTIEHPLIEAPVEIDIDPLTHAIRVRPRESDPQIYVKPFVEIGSPGVSRLNQAAKEHFAQFGNGGAQVAVREPVELSPFERRTFEPVLLQAASILSSAGVYYPATAPDPSDRSLPKFDEDLIVTDTWAVYARPRSGNLFVQDIERLKEAVAEAKTLPACAERIVSEPTDEEIYPGIELQSRIGATGTESANVPIESDVIVPDVFFPKPFNDAQVKIVRRLEKQDGVVVQGPPGTGKTHTIANIICHYLATGRSVLVVSKGEPALDVLRNHIPEEIRNLTISLLTNEREGLKQLETAVTCMANDVANKDTARLERERQDKEAEILELRKRVEEIDHRVCDLAKLQLNPVAKLNVSPAELAQQIVASAEKYKWLPDELGYDDRYNPQFSNDDIHAIRQARGRLGTDLAYVGCSLPSPNDLPDVASVCAIHSDLVRAAKLSETAEKKQLPHISKLLPDAVARAEQLLTELRKVRSILELMGQPEYEWIKPFHATWLEGGDTLKSRSLRLLIDEMRRLVDRRQDFLERPVEIPSLVGLRDDVIEAVHRAERSSRPFALISFGKHEAKGAFAKIKLAAKVPKTQSDWVHVADYFDFQSKVVTLALRWNAMARELRLPSAPKAFDEALTWICELLPVADVIHTAATRYHSTNIAAIQQLFPHGLDSNQIPRSAEAAAYAIETLETNISAEKLSASRGGLQTAVDRLQSCAGRVAAEILEFLRDSVGDSAYNDNEVSDRWQDLIHELRRVLALRSELATVVRVADLIEQSGAPNWATKLRSQVVVDRNDPWTPDIWQETWQFLGLESYLKHIDRREELRELSEERAKGERHLSKAMAELVRLRTYLGLKRRLGRGARLSALQQFVTAIRRIGTGAGIRARRYRGDARSAMAKCVEAVPCWIMPTWRASESLPAKLGAFDLVIVDEASQSDVMALPALIRAQKILVVGDDRQVSPSPVGLEERKLLQLRHSFLQDQPFADLLMPGSSLYDLALAVFPGERVLLNEHFRCVEPIIRFSFQFYPEKIEPVRIPKPSERLDPPLVDVYLPRGQRDGQKINQLEASAIVDEIERLVKDSAYEQRSVGVVCLIGRKQAQVIQNRLLQRIGEDAFLKHKITCGDSATFQGKERDLMFVSMIASPGKATAQTALLWKQRFNVALSRARDRMYLYRSVKPEDLRNPSDLKLHVINHFINPMPVPVQDTEELIGLCESDFERDVFQQLSKLGYRVTPQVTVGSFRIDLVVDGEDDRRLAIELDGDQYHGPDRWFEDWNRQKVLERVGWTFWRCWASSFTLDPEGCMEDLVATLAQMKIEPIGVGEGRHPYTEHRVDERSIGEELTLDEKSAEPLVDIGDEVIVSFDDNPRRHFVLTITKETNDLVNGMVSANSPSGNPLLGLRAEDEVSLEWNGNERMATVLEITKKRQTQDITASAAASPAGKSGTNDQKGLVKPIDSVAEAVTPFDDNRSFSDDSTGMAPVQQLPLFPEQRATDDEPTAVELAKYREYEHSMKQHEVHCKPINEWLENYRQRQQQR